MTTQAGKCVLYANNEAHYFTATCTDDAWTELLDGDSGVTAHLYEVMRGLQIKAYTGNYAAGGGYIRIRNTQTNQIKLLGPIMLVTEEKTMYINKPVTIQENDILECFTVAVPT